MSRTLMAAAVLAMGSCAGQGSGDKLFVHSQHEADIDFGAYATYAWMPDDKARANPVFVQYPELPGIIAAAVDRQLAAKGYEKTSQGAANFLVAMSASVQPVTVVSKHRYQGWAHGYNRSSLNNVNTATQLDKVAEGTLILEVIDTANEGVVWQSHAAGVIAPRDVIAKTVDATVARMLETFPPET